MNLPHSFTASATATPIGSVPITVEKLPTIQSAPPVEFGGPGDQWSPEDLLVGAVADCFVLAFRAIAAASKFEWETISCSVTGKLDKVERAIQFTHLDITARLTIPAGSDAERAKKLLEKSESACFISNSLKATKHLTTEIETV